MVSRKARNTRNRRNTRKTRSTRNTRNTRKTRSRTQRGGDPNAKYPKPTRHIPPTKSKKIYAGAAEQRKRELEILEEQMAAHHVKNMASHEPVPLG
jgi:hypothetical protein